MIAPTNLFPIRVSLLREAQLFATTRISVAARLTTFLLFITFASQAQWSTATLSQARSDLSSASIGSKAFFAGGTIGGTAGVSNVVDIYDNSTNTWSTATLSAARGQLVATSVGSKVFFAGGVGNIFPSNVVDIYDNSTNLWSTATLSQPRWNLSAATVGTKVLFSGGYINGSAVSDRVDIYDNSTNTWSTANLSKARSLLSATTVGTKVFFAGGYEGAQILSNVVDIYDNSTNTWSTATLSLPRGNLCATSVGAKVFFAGGSYYDVNQILSSSNVIDIYDNSNNTWSTTTLSFGSFSLSAASISSKAVIAGGYINASTVSDKVDIYDNNTNSWSSEILSIPRTRLAATSIGKKVFIAGGVGDVGYVDVVDIYDDSAVPTISSFTPESGLIGTSVTITGTNFGRILTNNVVYFGATRATVTSASPTQLTVTVPVGSTYQPITVLTNGLIAYSAKPFVVTFSGGPGFDANSFAAKVDFQTGSNASSVSIGDLDGDGKPDLVVANNGSGTVSVFRNTGSIGSISYAAKVNLTSAGGPFSVSIGDLDGDGKADIAAANVNSNTISVFRNTSSSAGSISYASKVDFISGTSPSKVSIGDLDGDGKADIVVANVNSNTISVFLNTSSGSGSISYADKVDFIIGTSPYSVSIGDLDGDGKADLSVALNSSSGTLSAFRNTSSGAGNISFSSKVDFTTGANPESIAIGDFDGDGKPDLVVVNGNSNTISVFLNTSSGSGSISYADKVDFITGSLPREVSIGDLDGDGKADLAVVNQTSTTVSVFRNTSSSAGSISYASKVDFISETQPLTVSICDLDGDGKADLAVAGGDVLSVLRNKVGNASAPTISSFTPAIGALSTSVIITGTNLTGATAVSFGGTAATSFTVVSSTSITAVVGSGTSGIVSVTTPGGTATLAGFTFVPAPTISSFTPLIGEPGATIFITGTNFSTTAVDNVVKFNGVNTLATSSTTTTITTIVPFGATTGVITVTVNGQTATSTTSFTVIPSNIPTIGIVAFYPFNGNANDASGNGNNGIVNGATLTADRFGNANSAYDFNQNYIRVNAAPVFDFNESMSINIWFLNKGNGGVFLSKHQRATLNSSYILYNETICGPTGYITDIGNNVQSIRDDVMCDTNNWHMLTITFNNPTLNVYIDGVLFGSKVTDNIKVTTLPVLFGAVMDPAQPNGVFPNLIGKLDDIIFYNRALNASEVMQLYDIPTPTISSFTPSSGPTGTIVTITGTNFSTIAANNIVKINGSLVSIIGAPTTTSLMVIANVGGKGKITVEVDGLIGTSLTDFCQSPTLSGGQPILICPGSIFEVQGNTGGLIYSWSPAEGLSITTGNRVIATPQTTTTYIVTATNTDGCSNSLTFRADVSSICTIPNLVGGTGLDAYRIFSVPLKLADKKIETVLASAMQRYGGYDQEKWRLVHYSNGDNLNFTDGLRTIEEGKGYWLLSVDPLNINVSGTAINATQNTPFVMNLDKGWNQIGNPFGFDVSWSDVLAQNNDLTSVGKLFVYDPASVSFKESDNFKAWGGGFVNTSAASALNIPVTVKQATGGRISSSDELEHNQIDQPSWFVPLKLQQGEAINDMGGIGMHINALEGRDEYDENSLPRFVKFLELNSYHNDYFQPRFMRDVVPSTTNYDWDLFVESNFGEGDATLSWVYKDLSRNNAQLLLYDNEAKVIIDMKKVGEYKFGSPTTRKLKIMYAIDEKHLSSESLVLGLPFPNPLSSGTTIPFITGADEIMISIYDMLGRKVKEVVRSKFEAGYHEIVWHGNDYLGERVSPGMYIVKISGSNSPATTVRIIVE